MKKRFTEEWIVRIRWEAQPCGMHIQELYRKRNFTEQTFFR